MLKPEKQTATAEMVNANLQSNGIHITVIDDGKVLTDQFQDCKMDMKKLNKILKKNKVDLKDVLLMTANSNGEINIVEKEKDL